MAQALEWEADEYEFFAKDGRWFRNVTLAVGALVLLALLLKNILFAIVLVVGGFALLIHGAKMPERLKYALTAKGARIGAQLFPYDRLHSFWVSDESRRRQVIIQIHRVILPHLVLPLPEELSDDQVREFLLQHLPEERHEESLADMLGDYFGF